MGKGSAGWYIRKATRTGGKKKRRNTAMAKPTRLAQKVYNWEAQWHHWNVAQYRSIYGPRRWIHHALDCYKVPRTVVRHRTGHQSSFFRPHDWSINLLEKHRNVASALHEAAHAIHAYYYGPVEEHHNQQWMGIYVWLLKMADLWPAEAITASLDARNIPYSTRMSPKVLTRKKPYGK